MKTEFDQSVVRRLDVAQDMVDIAADFSMTVRTRQAGPPERVAAMTVGIVDMTENAPHGGELHPDGDEFLHVISGKVRITADRLDEPVILGAGESCIVRANEWHKVDVMEPVRLLHMTPGPGGDHRPLEESE